MELNTGKLELTEHGFERMQERFPEQSKNKQSATNHVRSLVKRSEYIGVVPDKDGSDAHMFVFNKSISIHVSLCGTKVLSLFEIERKPLGLHHLKNKVSNLYKTEFRKISRAEAHKRRILNDKVLHNEAEIAALKLRRYKSRSDNVKKLCDQRIEILNKEIWSINNELKNIQIHKREFAFAIATENY